LNREFSISRSGKPWKSTVRYLPPVALALISLLVAMALLGPSCGKPKQSTRQKAPSPVAVISSVQGGVQVRITGTDAWLCGSAGTIIYEGDSIQTETQGKLSLVSTDGARVQVNQNAFLRLLGQSDRTNSLEVTRGEVWVEKSPNLKVVQLKTPAAVAKPTGPAVDLKVEPGGTSTLTVIKGEARFANDGGEVLVGRSEQSVAVPGQAPGVPMLVDTRGINSWALGYDYYVKMQIDPYFPNEEARDNAEGDARSKISSNPTDAWSHLSLGRTLIDAGNRAEAAAEFRSAIELDPQFSQAYSGLGKIALAESRWDDAMAAYAQARRADPKSIEALFGMGQSALGAGDLKEAVKWYKEALELERVDAKSLTALGIVKLLENDLEGAISDFREAIGNDPTLARIFRSLGTAYALKRRADLARDYLSKAVEKDLRDYLTWNSLGIGHVRDKNWDDAARCFRQLTDSDEIWTKATGFEDLGVGKEMSGDLRGGVTDLSRSLNLVPDMPVVLVNLGQAQLLLNKGRAALGSLSRAVELDPDNWYTHLALAEGGLTLGIFDRATAEARLSIQLNPAYWLSHLVLGLSLEGQGAPGEAKQELKTARGLAPKKNLSPAEHLLQQRAITKKAEHSGKKAPPVSVSGVTEGTRTPDLRGHNPAL
jgi:tetratricopeptide (TPR) repeat protein